jgi:hypothetical protein
MPPQLPLEFRDMFAYKRNGDLAQCAMDAGCMRGAQGAGAAIVE